MLPEDEYYRSVSRKRGSAGALIFKGDKLLVVETTYKPTLEIPGGVVEEGESYLAAAQRECREELGVEAALPQLLCVDYNNDGAERGDAVHFIFRGDIGTQEVHPASPEVRALHWLPVAEALARMEPKLARRVAAALQGLKTGVPVYAENGVSLLPPPAPSRKAPRPPGL